MAPSAAATKLKEEPVIESKDEEYSKKGIRGVLVGPPGSGKGTQVIYTELCIDEHWKFSGGPAN